MKVCALRYTVRARCVFHSSSTVPVQFSNVNKKVMEAATPAATAAATPSVTTFSAVTETAAAAAMEAAAAPSVTAEHVLPYALFKTEIGGGLNNMVMNVAQLTSDTCMRGASPKGPCATSLHYRQELFQEARGKVQQREHAIRRAL